LLFAPDFLLTECGSVLWGKAQRRLITIQEAETRLLELQTFPVTLSAGLNLVAPALKLALKIGHPIYDCIYLALAEELDVPLVTADQRFLKALQPHPPLAARVMHLADLP
jgi:predicted nucleic acid-binding protein